jgi:hypothetical protein
MRCKDLKKFISRIEFNKIAKATLAMVLAGSFTFSATSAFASGNTIQTEQNQTVDLEADPSADMNAAEQTTDKQETPSLLPGDFFYFAKIALEKIKLALTFDDVKEAKLLAKDASERLAEAESLFAAGDEKAALEVIKEALAAMNNANRLVDEKEKTTDEVTTVNEQSSDDQVTPDDVATEEPQKADEDGAEVKEVKTALSQNIIALTAAMEKVQNPVAKAALQKNIDKSKAKLAKKLEKREVKKQEKEPKKKHVIDETMNDETATSEDTTVKATTSENQDTNVTLPVNSEKEQVKQEVQAIQKGAQQEVKQVQQVAKQKHEEAKTFVKQKKEEVKQKVNQIKEVHQGNGKNN